MSIFLSRHWPGIEIRREDQSLGYRFVSLSICGVKSTADTKATKGEMLGGGAQQTSDVTSQLPAY